MKIESDFNEALRMQRAFNELVTCLVDTGDDYSREALGIQLIAELIADRLEAAVAGTAGATAEGIQSMREGFIRSHMEGKDPATIAQALNLKRTTVERVMRKLLAADPEPVAKRA